LFLLGSLLLFGLSLFLFSERFGGKLCCFIIQTVGLRRLGILLILIGQRCVWLYKIVRT
jgi:hypothetical protein